jgi:hypothetical protein
MTKTTFSRLRDTTTSRRGLLRLASGASVFTFWQRKAHSFPALDRYVDRSRLSELPIATRPAHRSLSTPKPMCGGAPAASVR